MLNAKQGPRSSGIEESIQWGVWDTPLIQEDPMLGENIKAKFRPRDYDLFVGLDVDKRHIDATFLDQDQRMKSMKMPHSADHLLSYTRRHFPGRKVAFAYEAGPTGYGLYDRLTAAGHACLVVSASLIPTAPGRRVKTNRLDSRKISQSLSGGELKGIHVPNAACRHLRHLVRLRDTFVQQTVAAQVRLKAMLLLEGLPFPEPSGRWSVAAWEALRTLPCAPALRFKMDRLLAAHVFAHEQTRQTTREIRRFCQDTPELARNLRWLLSVPGVGRIIAPHMLARIGDERRIGRSCELASFLGLVPTEDSTGDHVHRGAITRAGDRRLRAKLIQAAWVAIRQDPELHAFYLRIYRRNPRPIAAQKAITAVAAKLCRRIACVLKQQRPYVVRENPTAFQEETVAPQGMTRTSAETSPASGLEALA
jgi:transposase